MTALRFVFCPTHGKRNEKQAAKHPECSTCRSFIRPVVKARRPGES